MRKKGIFLLAVGLACMMALVGCGAKQPNNEQPSQPEKVNIETAEQLANELKKTDLPIDTIVVYNEGNDPNELLGTEGSYVSKVNFADMRLYQTSQVNPDGGSIEVFKAKQDAEKRKQYIDSLGDTSPMFDENSFIVNDVFLVRINKKIHGDAFEQYKSYAEQAMEKGVTESKPAETVSDEQKATIKEEDKRNWAPINQQLLIKNFSAALGAQISINTVSGKLEVEKIENQKVLYSTTENKMIYANQYSIKDGSTLYDVIAYADKEGLIYSIEAKGKTEGEYVDVNIMHSIIWIIDMTDQDGAVYGEMTDAQYNAPSYSKTTVRNGVSYTCTQNNEKEFTFIVRSEKTAELAMLETTTVMTTTAAPVTTTTKVTTAKPTTKATTKATTAKKQSRTVYVTPTGKKYHYSGSCNGGKYTASTLDDALSRGLTPCNKCVG